MEDADGQVLETLVIMFTVVTVGLLVMIGTFPVPNSMYTHVLSVLAAFWAWGLIAVKRLYFWGQRKGRDQMFSLMEIHVYEISSSVALLLILLLIRILRDIWSGIDQRSKDSEVSKNKLKDSEVMHLFLIGLCITGFGMGMSFGGGPTLMSVFFPGDLCVFFIAIGLSVVSVGYRHAHPKGHFGIDDPLIVYTLVLLATTYIAGGWQ